MKNITQIGILVFTLLLFVLPQNIQAQEESFDLEKLTKLESSLENLLVDMEMEGKKTPRPMALKSNKFNDANAMPKSPNTKGDNNSNISKQKNNQIKKSDSPHAIERSTTIATTQMTAARKKSCISFAEKAEKRIQQSMTRSQEKLNKGKMSESAFNAQMNRIEKAKEKLADYKVMAKI